MNQNNYATFDASKRLLDAGITLETDYYHRTWIGEQDSIFYDNLVRKETKCRLQNGGDDPTDLPNVVYCSAPSMSEVWRELMSYLNQENQNYGYIRIGNNNGITYVELPFQEDCTFENINSIDALISLLIWVRSRR